MTAVSFSFPTRPDPDKAPDQELIESRRFTAEQHEAILQALRGALQVDADEDLPLLFRLPVAVVLTLTTFDDIIARYRVPETREHPRYQALDHALKLYCTSSQYSHAMITSNCRYDLNLAPGELLTDADRKSGENRLRTHKTQQDRVRRASMSSTIAPET